MHVVAQEDPGGLTVDFDGGGHGRRQLGTVSGDRAPANRQGSAAVDEDAAARGEAGVGLHCGDPVSLHGAVVKRKPGVRLAEDAAAVRLGRDTSSGGVVADGGIGELQRAPIVDSAPPPGRRGRGPLDSRR
jgi:hypothetical protein